MSSSRIGTDEDILSRRFARWLWNDQSRDAEIVCARTDLGLNFDTVPLKWHRGMSSIYQCYQGLYSSRHRLGIAPDLGRVTGSHPLRVVFYDQLPEDNPYYAGWLENFERHYDLRKRTEHVVYPPKTPDAWKRDIYTVLEFAPKSRVEGRCWEDVRCRDRRA